MQELNREEKQQIIIDEVIKHDYHGLLFLPTATGKTRIVIEAIKASGFKSILWVCGTTKFRDKGLKEEFKKWGGDYSKVTPICWQSLANHKKSYDLVVLDEVQMITPSRAKYFDTVKYSKILGVTGTKPRDRDKLFKLFIELKLPIIYELKVEEAVNQLLIADYEIEVIYCQLDNITKVPIKTKKGATFYATEQESYDWYTNQMAIAKYNNNYARLKQLALGRAQLIYKSKSKISAALDIVDCYSDKRIISFSKSTDVANMLSSTAFHSKLPKKVREKNYEAFNNLKVNHIATVEAANTSLNFVDIELVFIQQLDSNPANYLQRQGRGLRIRKDYVAKIVILCAVDTQDEVWVNECISSLNPHKIKFYNINHLKCHHGK